MPSKDITAATQITGKQSLDYSGGERIDAQNAAKNIDQHGTHTLVAQQNFKGVRYLLRICAAAHIQKVGRHAARVFDDVHGGHGQPGAVDQAGNIAIELDVIQVVF